MTKQTEQEEERSDEDEDDGAKDERVDEDDSDDIYIWLNGSPTVRLDARSARLPLSFREGIKLDGHTYLPYVCMHER